MNAGIKAKWVAALRSGKYPQCTDVLRAGTGKGFCCLGVVLDVIDATAWSETIGSFDWGGRMGGASDEELDAEMREQIGIGKSAVGDLITMNDRGSSFAEIADWIEENL